MIRHPSARIFRGDRHPVSFTIAAEDSGDFTAAVTVFDAHDITAAKTAEQGVRGNADNIVLGFQLHFRRASTCAFVFFGHLARCAENDRRVPHFLPQSGQTDGLFVGWSCIGHHILRMVFGIIASAHWRCFMHSLHLISVPPSIRQFVSQLAGSQHFAPSLS